ncbi:hypothetical protein VTL71DRAFT_4314 [Oculimacula yallundae]|uniref:Uncharacterized protein n=1 Tax=Oculimacula yallundae TaxID=86028 RepID=A0ABR4C5G4_9HELO
MAGGAGSTHPSRNIPKSRPESQSESQDEQNVADPASPSILTESHSIPVDANLKPVGDSQAKIRTASQAPMTTRGGRFHQKKGLNDELSNESRRPESITAPIQTLTISEVPGNYQHGGKKRGQRQRRAIAKARQAAVLAACANPMFADDDTDPEDEPDSQPHILEPQSQPPTTSDKGTAPQDVDPTTQSQSQHQSDRWADYSDDDDDSQPQPTSAEALSVGRRRPISPTILRGLVFPSVSAPCSESSADEGPEGPRPISPTILRGLVFPSFSAPCSESSSDDDSDDSPLAPPAERDPNLNSHEEQDESEDEEEGGVLIAC